jgi:hypothetical protein
MADPAAEVTKPTFEVGIISFLTVLAIKVAPKEWQEVATSLAPLVGGSIAYLIRSYRRKSKHKQLVALETHWIAQRTAERDTPGISVEKQKEIDADIEARKRNLEQLQRDNLRID